MRRRRTGTSSSRGTTDPAPKNHPGTIPWECGPLLTPVGSQADKILSRYEADPAGRMLVVLGDSLAPVDLRELWQRAGTPGLDSAVALAEMRLPYGVALVDGDRVASFHEKPATGILINTGYMVLGSRAIDYLRAGKSLSQCLECLAAGRQLGGWLCSGVLTSVNSVEELGSAHSRFLGEP